MHAPTKPDEPARRPSTGPERGAPPTHAAHAVRKDISVRVSVKTPAVEPEEIREEGYGHGV
jgi:hypothetical protein